MNDRRTVNEFVVYSTKSPEEYAKMTTPIIRSDSYGHFTIKFIQRR